MSCVSHHKWKRLKKKLQKIKSSFFVNFKFNIRWTFTLEHPSTIARWMLLKFDCLVARFFLLGMSSIIYLIIIVIQIAFSFEKTDFRSESIRLKLLSIKKHFGVVHVKYIQIRFQTRGFIGLLFNNIFLKTGLDPLRFTDSCNLNEKINCIVKCRAGCSSIWHLIRIGHPSFISFGGVGGCYFCCCCCCYCSCYYLKRRLDVFHNEISKIAPLMCNYGGWSMIGLECSDKIYFDILIAFQSVIWNGESER